LWVGSTGRENLGGAPTPQRTKLQAIDQEPEGVGGYLFEEHLE
jgi:hypothetical protein